MSSSKHDTDSRSDGLRKRRRSCSASPVPECDAADYGRGKRVARPSQKAILAGLAAPAQCGQRDGSKKTVLTVTSSIRLKLNLWAGSKATATASAVANSTTPPANVDKKRKAPEEAPSSREAESSDSTAAPETGSAFKRIKFSSSASLQTLKSAQETEDSSPAESEHTSVSAESALEDARVPTPPTQGPRKISAAEAPVAYLLQHLRSMPMPPESEPEKRDAFIGFRNIVIGWLTGTRFSYYEKKQLCCNWWKTQRDGPFELEWIRVRDKCDKVTAKATLIKEQVAAAREAHARQLKAEERRRAAEEERREKEARQRALQEDQMAARALLAMRR